MRHLLTGGVLHGFVFPQYRMFHTAILLDRPESLEQEWSLVDVDWFYHFLLSVGLIVVVIIIF
jgi:hypothetical protein